MQVGTGKSILNGIAIGKLKLYKKKEHDHLGGRSGRHRRGDRAF